MFIVAYQAYNPDYNILDSLSFGALPKLFKSFNEAKDFLLNVEIPELLKDLQFSDDNVTVQTESNLDNISASFFVNDDIWSVTEFKIIEEIK